MKIALISPLPNLGGTEKQVLALTRLLTAKGHRVEVLGSPGPLTNDIATAANAYRPLTATNIFRSAMGKGRVLLHCQMARCLPQAVLTKLLLRMRGRQTGLLWHARGIKGWTYPWVIVLCRVFGIVVIANCRDLPPLSGPVVLLVHGGPLV